MALDPGTSFGLLNNIINTTGTDVLSQLNAGVPGVSQIQQTNAAGMAAPNFAMPGGGGFYNSPQGQVTRQNLMSGQFAPIRDATINNAARMAQLADMLARIGQQQGQSAGMQSQFRGQQDQLQAAQQESLQGGVGGILGSLFGSSVGGIGGGLAGLAGFL